MELPVKSPVHPSSSSSYTIETKNLMYSYTRIGPCNQFTTWLFSGRKISPPKYILKNVTLQANPGQITAVAGPSGSGKTTLLEILAGKISPSRFSGHVLVNSDVMNPETFRRLSGYVTQDDALFPLLTVEETLTYSALLRLPRGTKALAGDRAKLLMRELGLGHISGSRIGDGSSKFGISGGERRRVSIGAELVHNPKVLLIDEPTSGLDSSSALHVISVLRTMAACQGKTIVMTIHQPGSRILELIDRLVLLSNGVVAHNGPLHLLESNLRESGHVIPRHVNVLEFAMDVVICGDCESDLTAVAHRAHEKARENETRPPYANSRADEALILGERFVKNIFRTKELFATRVAQALLVGFMLGTIYMNVKDDRRALQTRLGFFAFTLSFLLTSTTEALPIFLQERRIFMRETSRGAYRVSSYVLANTVVFFPFLLLVGILYSTPAYWMVGLRRDPDGFFYFALVVWIVVLMSNSFTACFSALVPNFIMGTSVIAGVMGSFFLFSGYFIAEGDIPRFWKFMHYLSLFKYPIEGMMINEYGGKGGGKCLERSSSVGGGECLLYGHEYLRQQGLKESQRWTHLGVMFGFVFGYRVLCFFILWYRSCGTRN